MAGLVSLLSLSSLARCAARVLHSQTLPCISNRPNEFGLPSTSNCGRLCVPDDAAVPVKGPSLPRPMKAGFASDLTVWTGPAIELAVAETKAFKTRLATPATT